MVSGGPDSACLAAGLTSFLGPDRIVAFHVNFGLRPEADADQATAASLCEALGVELVAERTGPPEGNLQDWARRERYGRAFRLREARSVEWVAAGHSRTDRVETMLYRLAASPGTRALLGMESRRDHLIRPLIGLGREDLRRIAESAGLPFADDRSNRDPAFARARVRGEVLPVLREINPAAERNIERTRAELAEDEDLLAGLAGAVIVSRGILSRDLETLHPALRRRALRILAEGELKRPVPVPGAVAAEVLRLGLHPEGGRIDAGGGAFFRARAGRITIEPPKAPPDRSRSP